jgi:uncharacterized phage-associated protein
MKMIDMGEIKMVNAIMYFAKNIKYRHQVEIFKLLSFLDFEHFKEVGLPVTDQYYFAHNYGPVPKDLKERIDTGELSAYFKDRIKLVKKKYGMREGLEFNVKLNKKPDLSVFSPREKRILEELVTKFKDANAEQMTQISHEENLPYDITVREKGLYNDIDYFVVIKKGAIISEETARARFGTRERMRELFGRG